MMLNIRPRPQAVFQLPTRLPTRGISGQLPAFRFRLTSTCLQSDGVTTNLMPTYPSWRQTLGSAAQCNTCFVLRGEICQCVKLHKMSELFYMQQVGVDNLLAANVFSFVRGLPTVCDICDWCSSFDKESFQVFSYPFNYARRRKNAVLCLVNEWITHTPHTNTGQMFAGPKRRWLFLRRLRSDLTRSLLCFWVVRCDPKRLKNRLNMPAVNAAVLLFPSCFFLGFVQYFLVLLHFCILIYSYELMKITWGIFSISFLWNSPLTLSYHIHTKLYIYAFK